MKKYIYIICAIALVSIVVFFIFNKNSPKNLGLEGDVGLDTNNIASSSLPLNPELAKKIGTQTPAPNGYVKYQNNKYSFYLYHLPDAKITEIDQGQGAMIVTIENEKKVRGMQIFIVPYWEKTISEKRFKADVPSGMRTNVESTTVGGVEAVTFNSVDASLGATRELWFIRGGYLYEVTTFQDAGDWFAPIMQTWGFL